MADPVYRHRNDDDLKALAAARASFLKENFDKDGKAQYPDHALSDAIGLMMDLMIDRDCDSDRRITSIVYDPRCYEPFVVCYQDRRCDEEGKSTLEIMRMSDERLETNRSLATLIITRASEVIQKGIRHGGHELGMVQVSPAAEVPDMQHFEAALAVVEDRVARLGILTSDCDGWPEKDESLAADTARVFGHLRLMFEATKWFSLAQRDRALYQDIIMVPFGEPVGRAEMRAARNALLEATRLITTPAERSNFLDGIHSTEQRQAAEEELRQQRRADLRREIGTLPGLTDGMPDDVAARVRAWVETNQGFPVYRDGKPGSARDAFIDHVTAQWGPEVMRILPKAMMRPGTDGLQAMQALARHFGEQFAPMDAKNYQLDM